MRELVRTLANDLLDAMARKGEMDLIRDYSLPLPMTIITEILGAPTQDRDKFHIITGHRARNDGQPYRQRVAGAATASRPDGEATPRPVAD
jgi:cytochrome P450